MPNTELTSLGHYRVLRKLGRGSFAEVYRAKDTRLGREVALKILHPQLLTDPDFVRRFENDARAAARLDHPHIVTVYDIGHTDGRLFIPMQYCSGGSLADRIKRDGPLSYDEATRVIDEIADALDYAHRAGFIHRDIKPSNILFDAQGRAVLADFGLVKSAEDSVIARSSTGGIVGTPAYIAPEIWDDQPATAETDVYALACVLYEMLTGDVLFERTSTLATMKAHTAPRQFPTEWPKDTPAGLEAAVRQALAPDQTKRYASAGALAAAVSDCRSPKATRRPPWRIITVVLGTSIACYATIKGISLAREMLPTYARRPDAPAVIELNVAATTTPSPRPSTGLEGNAIRTSETPRSPTQIPVTPSPTTEPSPTRTTTPSPTKPPSRTPTATPPPTEVPIATATAIATPSPTVVPAVTCPEVTGPFSGLWQSVGDQLGCVESAATRGLIAEESFEGGLMFWREPYDLAQAVVAFNDGTWRIFGHSPYIEGSPEFSCLDPETPAQCPPTPKRGFGMMWCDIPAIRSGLGNAVTCERGYTGAMQVFETGFTLQSDSGTVYVFYENGTWATWESQ